jgi:16S rRNA U516 pseudouridylate synthase RsuA-like enzyme
MGWVVNPTHQPPNPREREPVHIVQEGRFRRVQKILPAIGFEVWTVHQ